MTGRRGVASPKKRDVLGVAPERQSLSAQQAAEPQEPGVLEMVCRSGEGKASSLRLIINHRVVDNHPLSSWRSAAGQEVDFVLENSAGRLAGVEVKASATLGANDVRGFEALAHAAGKRWVRGVVLYTGTALIPFTENLHGLPLPLLWSARLYRQSRGGREVDGREAPVLRANQLFRPVNAEPGQRAVFFYFRQRGLLARMLISAVTLVGLMLLYPRDPGLV